MFMFFAWMFCSTLPMFIIFIMMFRWTFTHAFVFFLFQFIAIFGTILGVFFAFATTFMYMPETYIHGFKAAADVQHWYVIQLLNNAFNYVGPNEAPSFWKAYVGTYWLCMIDFIRVFIRINVMNGCVGFYIAEVLFLFPVYSLLIKMYSYLTADVNR